ncbi:ABC transporter ATP-binding protein [Dissulfurirhabdus thermomarina]|nr:ABC transporter ATP-binding protein [Dissulfurirhabdus thermomarina]
MLAVHGLHVRLQTERGPVPAVRGLDLSVDRGESVCLVGESGCGKTLTALAVLRLLPSPPLEIAGGSIRFDGRELTTLPPEEMRRLRGRRIAMVFQEPMTALNPVFTVGRQIAEVLEVHLGTPPSEARRAALELLEQVGVPEPASRIDAYPHQLSGGLRQRAMIAMALACAPDLLIADEPTTALDVTVQAQILDLLARLQRERGLGLLLVTHNLGVVAQVAHRVLIMYAGRIVEEAPVEALFAHPRHPYTRGLLASVPYGVAEGTRRLPAIPGTVPPLEAVPAGCPFHDRCPEVMDVCRRVEPAARRPGPGVTVRCHLW